MFSFSRCLVALLAGFTLIDAKPLQSRYDAHEKREVPSRAWIKRDPVARNALLPMKIGLKQQNLHRGYDYLLDVYKHRVSPILSRLIKPQL